MEAHKNTKTQDVVLTLKVLVVTIDASTTSSMSDHKGFKLQ